MICNYVQILCCELTSACKKLAQDVSRANTFASGLQTKLQTLATWPNCAKQNMFRTQEGTSRTYSKPGVSFNILLGDKQLETPPDFKAPKNMVRFSPALNDASLAPTHPEARARGVCMCAHDEQRVRVPSSRCARRGRASGSHTSQMWRSSLPFPRTSSLARSRRVCGCSAARTPSTGMTSPSRTWMKCLARRPRSRTCSRRSAHR